VVRDIPRAKASSSLTSSGYSIECRGEETLRSITSVDRRKAFPRQARDPLENGMNSSFTLAVTISGSTHLCGLNEL